MRFLSVKIARYLIVFVCSLCVAITAHSQKTALFNPVLGDGADPWVVKHNGYYYMCAATGKKGVNAITVSKSEKLSEPGKPVSVWRAPVNSWNSKNIWAPELHHIRNRWYIYYAAGKSGPPFIYQRSGVLQSVTDDPQGKYIDKGILKTGVDESDPSGTIWAIDVSVINFKGSLYAVWSGWDKNALTDKTPQNIYIASMSNPWTINSARVKISSPKETWETGGPLDLDEGPEFLAHNSQLFIIYSTRESWTPQYRLGQLKLLDSTKSLISAANWQKTGPVFEGTTDVYGVGHASFTTSPDGSQWWIAYHTKKSKSDGWQREVRLQPFTWNEDGSPYFGKPTPPGKLVAKPSGEK